MRHPVAIHHEENSDYRVTLPDLTWCFSVGKTLDEAFEMARAALDATRRDKAAGR